MGKTSFYENADPDCRILPDLGIIAGVLPICRRGDTVEIVGINPLISTVSPP
jgi:hypothetical protein